MTGRDDDAYVMLAGGELSDDALEAVSGGISFSIRAITRAVRATLSSGLPPRRAQAAWRNVSLKGRVGGDSPGAQGTSV